MRRLTALTMLVIIVVLPFTGVAAAHPPGYAARLSDIGRTQAIAGFAVTLRWVKQAHEAGAADYVAGRGNVFLLVDVQIKRAGSHDSYYADPQDFHVETARGGVIDSEQFGMAHELTARHVYRQPVEGVIGFEVPANDRHLRLLWQPTFESNPDAQAVWSIGTVGKSIPYYQ